MPTNDYGEPMGFEIDLPTVTQRQIDEVLTFTATVEPLSANYDEIEAVCAWAGRITASGQQIDKSLIDWLKIVPVGRLLAVKVITHGVIANANYLRHKRVESAIYAQVALTTI